MTTYELPPEPPIGSRVCPINNPDEVWLRDGTMWANGSWHFSWAMLLDEYACGLTLIEPDPWPTAPLIVATRSGRYEGRTLLQRYVTDGDYVDILGVAQGIVEDVAIEGRDDDSLANVVPVTVVPVAALPVLWSALEQWLNNGVATFTEDVNRLVGAVESLRGQIDALGVDL